jgi:heme/copper-type cytochrome/quinol oxidase subunit 3
LADVLTPAVEDHADHGHDDHHEEHLPTNTGLSHNKLGMWVFLGSECLLFGGLISTFLLLKGRHEGQVEEGLIEGEAALATEVFDIWFTSLSSFVLLMSSLTMVLAVSAANRGDSVRTRLWLTTTAFLGSVFIAGQVYEFTSFVREGLGYTTNQFSSAFYTLTGFHGIHVTLGILMLVALVMLSFSGRLNKGNAETVEIVGLYWHFVDVVWIFVFTIVYLVP